MFGRRTLPLPLDLHWPMKAWEDAKLELRYERAHMIMTIEHELVRGVTPAMLDWWFRHIGGEVEINGRTYSRYRVWLERHILGSEVFSLEHWFEPADGGTRYRSRMELGADTLFGRLLFNRLIRPMIFSDLMGPAWLKHNVEEVGNLEQFLPALHAREAGL